MLLIIHVNFGQTLPLSTSSDFTFSSNSDETYTIGVPSVQTDTLNSGIVNSELELPCLIIGNLSLCAGQSTQLCVPSVLGETYLWSTGATSNCITVNAAGDYAVTVTTVLGIVSTCNVVVTVDLQLPCLITGNLSILIGQSTQLCVPSVLGSTYLWSTGATTNCITANAAGNYSVTVTNALGCVSTCSATVTVDLPLPCAITGSLSLCAGQSTQLCVPSVLGATYLWSTGATTNCITVSAAGNYAVTITTALGSVSTCNVAVTVALPLPCLITGNLTILTGQSTQLCVPSVLGFTYLWSTGATTNCITANAAGNYSVTVTNALGCVSTCSATVTVDLPLPCLITGNLSLCAGQSTQLCVPSVLGATYLWSTGATTNCITVNAAGNYSVTITTALGSVSTCNVAVTVALPIPCLITGNLTILTGQSTQLCVPSVLGSTYLWSTGATTNCITANAAGNYSVTVTNALGCVSTCSATVTVDLPLPCAITGSLSLCAGQSTQLCVPSVLGATYLWSTGATTNCITVNAAGNYAVTITTALGSVSTCNVAVTVALPLPCLITGNLTILTGQSTQLCVPSVLGSTYLWSTGATTNCITANAAGNYSVTVTNALGCVSTCSATVTVDLPLPCVITGSLSLCAGQSTQLCVPSVLGATYLWSTGATTNCITVSAAGNYAVTITTALGSVSTCNANVTVGLQGSCLITGNLAILTGQSTQLCVPSVLGSTYLWSTGATTNCITANAAGNYSVTVTNILGCVSTCSATVTVDLPLPCAITGSLSLCAGQSTQLCVPSVLGATYLWSTGATTNCITVSAAGNYAVTITTALGSVSTCNVAVTVDLQLPCLITGNLSILIGQSTQLCVPSILGSTYLWSTGATTNCITANAAGNYSVTVTNILGCVSTCSATVTVDLPLPCAITGSLSLCAGQSTQLCVPSVLGATYLWSTGATTNCITVSAAGNYAVTITTALGSVSTCNVAVTVALPLPCLITGNLAILTGQSTQLCVPSILGSTYLWSTGATTNCISANAAGNYSVTVTNALGCVSTCSATVTLDLPLPCVITGSLSLCAGQSTQLCVPSVLGATYLWSTGATTNCITVSAAGNYAVTITTALGSVSTCNVAVTVDLQLPCLITGNLSILIGQSTQLCVPSVLGSTYLWSTGATTNCITANAAGNYSVTVTNALGCVSTCSATVTVDLPLPCVITGSLSLCAGQSTQLCVPSVLGATYLWSTGATTNCITVSAAGNYAVTITTALGSVSTCNATVTVGLQGNCLITGNLTILTGQSTQLCVPSVLGSTYLWSTGATTNCITANAAGNYSVTVTNVLGCVSTCSATVTVDLPLPCVITGSLSLCAGQSTQLCVPSVLGATYLWSTGATTNCITVNAAGNYAVTITTALGSVSTCNVAVTVTLPLPCLITGNLVILTGQSTQLCVPSVLGSTYLWSTGATTNCITANAAGNYSVTVTNALGCVSTCSATVTVDLPLPCVITGSLSLCAGQSTQLCVPSVLGATYLWSTGATTNCITVSAAGNYSVTITTALGSVSNCNANVTVGLQGSCLITGNLTILTGQSTQLCVPSVLGSTYLWSTGATTNCITANAAGNYSVTVTNALGCVSTCSATVTVDLPLPCAITGSLSLCAGQSTQLCVPSVLGATYLWSTGATTNCITVSAAGNYAVTITTALGSVSTCNANVTVGLQGSCLITGNLAILTGQSTQLCVPSVIGSTYLWSTGATTNCITANAAGNYSVTVTNALGCVSTCSATVTVDLPLPCAITGSLSLCAGQSTQLCVPSVLGATYLWSTGATTNCITVNAAGNYAVTITTALGSVSTCNVAVTVALPLPCLITGNLAILTGQSTQLCVPSVLGSTYLWSTGATTNCITANAAGNYSVTVTNALGCVSTCSATVTVDLPLPCVITGSLSLCAGQSTQLCVPSVLGATYLWSTGATTNCITVNAAGNYTVTITTALGSVSTCNATVTVGLQGSCLITGNISFCSGQSTQLCVPLTAGSTYLWSTGATTNCINVNTAGNYSVTVTAASGCISTCNKVVTVTPQPVCLITGNSSICQGQSTQLCVPSVVGTTYLWSTGATTNCITINAAGDYSVTVTNASGCTNICNKTVTINQQGACLITGNGAICQGQSTQLCVPVGALSYLWNTGATTNCITVSTAGTYSVTVTEGVGCTSICNKVVTVSPLPSCDITGNCNICEGQSSEICAPSGFASYLWSTGETTSCITVNTAGNYAVTVTNANGCSRVCNRDVVVNLVPTCSITGGDFCQGQTTELCAPSGALKYLWSTGATTRCITINETGYYCVTITYSSGCISFCSKTFTQLTAITFVSTVVQPMCSALGSITIAPNGGTAPYTYLWSSGQTTASINNLTGGTYSVTVTDANGCTGVKSIIIIPTTSVNLSCSLAQTRPISCSGAADGEAVVTATGGTPPYTYHWQNAGSLSTGLFLRAGINTVTVTDANGCTTSCSILLLQPNCTPLTGAGTISGNQNYCNASELTAISESTPALGGSGTIEYLWMYSDITADFSVTGWNIVPNATGKDLPTNLLPVITRKTNFIRRARRLGCCLYIESNIISKVPTVVTAYTADRFTCTGNTNTFTATDNGADAFYQWVFEGANITFSNSRVVTVTFTSLGIKTVTLGIVKNGCTQTSIGQVEVIDCVKSYGTLMSFTAKIINRKDVELNWVTVDENRASKYLVEKSPDNTNFTEIGSIDSKNLAHNVYTFIDPNPKMGRAFYRIHQVTPVFEHVSMSKTERVLLLEVGTVIVAYPNPVGSILIIEPLDGENTEGVIELYNQLGGLVKTQKFAKDQVRYEIEVADLSKGNYIVRMRRNDGKTATTKMTKM